MWNDGPHWIELNLSESDLVRRFLHKELRPNCRPIKTFGLPVRSLSFVFIDNWCFLHFLSKNWAIWARLSIPDIDTYFASYRWRALNLNWVTNSFPMLSIWIPSCFRLSRNFLNMCSFHKSGQVWPSGSPAASGSQAISMSPGIPQRLSFQLPSDAALTPPNFECENDHGMSQGVAWQPRTLVFQTWSVSLANKGIQARYGCGRITWICICRCASIYMCIYIICINMYYIKLYKLIYLGTLQAYILIISPIHVSATSHVARKKAFFPPAKHTKFEEWQLGLDELEWGLAPVTRAIQPTLLGYKRDNMIY
jgi:hypothetical protein